MRANKWFPAGDWEVVKQSFSVVNGRMELWRWIQPHSVQILSCEGRPMQQNLKITLLDSLWVTHFDNSAKIIAHEHASVSLFEK